MGFQSRNDDAMLTILGPANQGFRGHLGAGGKTGAAANARMNPIPTSYLMGALSVRLVQTSTSHGCTHEVGDRKAGVGADTVAQKPGH